MRGKVWKKITFKQLIDMRARARKRYNNKIYKNAWVWK